MILRGPYVALSVCLLTSACLPQDVADVPVLEGCGDTAPGQEKIRSMFASAFVPHGESCEAIEQRATCLGSGNLSEWIPYRSGQGLGLAQSCEVLPEVATSLTLLQHDPSNSTKLRMSWRPSNHEAFLQRQLVIHSGQNCSQYVVRQLSLSSSQKQFEHVVSNYGHYSFRIVATDLSGQNHFSACSNSVTSDLTLATPQSVAWYGDSSGTKVATAAPLNGYVYTRAFYANSNDRFSGTREMHVFAGEGCQGAPRIVPRESISAPSGVLHEQGALRALSYLPIGKHSFRLVHKGLYGATTQSPCSAPLEIAEPPPAPTNLRITLDVPGKPGVFRIEWDGPPASALSEVRLQVIRTSTGSMSTPEIVLSPGTRSYEYNVSVTGSFWVKVLNVSSLGLRSGDISSNTFTANVNIVPPAKPQILSQLPLQGLDLQFSWTPSPTTLSGQHFYQLFESHECGLANATPVLQMPFYDTVSPAMAYVPISEQDKLYRIRIRRTVTTSKTALNFDSECSNEFRKSGNPPPVLTRGNITPDNSSHYLSWTQVPFTASQTLRIYRGANCSYRYPSISTHEVFNGSGHTIPGLAHSEMHSALLETRLSSTWGRPTQSTCINFENINPPNSVSWTPSTTSIGLPSQLYVYAPFSHYYEPYQSGTLVNVKILDPDGVTLLDAPQSTSSRYYSFEPTRLGRHSACTFAQRGSIRSRLFCRELNVVEEIPLRAPHTSELDDALLDYILSN